MKIIIYHSNLYQLTLLYIIVTKGNINLEKERGKCKFTFDIGQLYPDSTAVSIDWKEFGFIR